MDENKSKFWNPVFIISLIISLAIVIYAVGFNDQFSVASNWLLNFLEVNFGWLYLLSVMAILIFGFAVAFSKYGNIKLGPDDSQPEYSTVTWFGMLFGCAMGIGLIFWGLSEPICHFAAENIPGGIEPGTDAAAMFAFRSSFMDWTFHPFAIYCVMGMGIGYMSFRKGRPQLISSVLEPLIGEKLTRGWLGKLVDILAIFATLCGIVTSLGLGTMQIGAGLDYLTNGAIPNTLITLIIIVAVISVIYIGTAVIGIDKGIATVGNINLVLAGALMILCFILGPSVDQLNNLIGGVGAYFQNFFQDSMLLNTYGDNSWTYGWRIFYWAWWIAWAPFVGTFIARISRGRTIRQFVVGAMVVPPLVAFIWVSVLGSMPLTLFFNGTWSLDQLVTLSGTPEVALFATFAEYPLGIVISIIALVLVITFFVTSANSGTFALGTLSSEGDLNPSKTKMMFWGVIQSLLAVGMLMAGGLKPLQTMSVASAFPFMFVLIAFMFAFPRALKADRGPDEVIEGAAEPAAEAQAE